ncbi:MAG: glycosyltransferase family 4 protein [Polyangiaceae bacterium]|nr:glycosyltransferase family 4 protein [Polyangiaceae bacterium]
MAKIALFTPYLPAPAFTGGRIRISELARGLSEVGEVHLFAQAGKKERAEAASAAELQTFASVYVTQRLQPIWPWLKLPTRVLRGSPRGWKRAVEREGPFDLLVAEHSHAAGLAFDLKAPLLLDEHNIESRYVAAKWQATGKRQRPHELKKLEAWERTLWRRAEKIVAVTEADRAHIAEFATHAPVLIPNGVDLAKIRFIPPSERRSQKILFVGLMDHPPNIEAARFLAEQVMPRVWREKPEARLTLCGANPAREVLKLQSERVEVTGRVHSVAPYLEQARVCAMPLSQGAGSSLKILEALASGLPLVATEVAVRGFSLTAGQDYRLATDAETTALHLRSLLTADGDDLQARRGRSFAEEFAWPGMAQRFAGLASELLPSVLQQRKPR